MRAGLGVYELDIYAKSITPTLNRSFQHIADV
jgi:hypothetical protein